MGETKQNSPPVDVAPREAPHLAVAAADPDGGADGLDGVNSVHRNERWGEEAPRVSRWVDGECKELTDRRSSEEDLNI